MNNLFIIIIFICLNCVIQSFSQIVKNQCANYSGQSVALDFSKLNGVWYPLYISRDSSSRTCVRLLLKQSNNSYNYELFNQEEKVIGRLTPRDNYALNDNENDISYFLATDFTNYLSTYTCRYFGNNYEFPIIEWFTVYGSDAETDVKQYFDKIKDIAGQPLGFEEVVQNKCNDTDELRKNNLGAKFNVSENCLIDVDFNKLIGNWSLRALNERDTSEICAPFFISTPLINKLKWETYLDNRKYKTFKLSKINGTRALNLFEVGKFKRVGIRYPIYLDNNYFLLFKIDPITNKPVLAIFSKNKDILDLEAIYDILFNKISNDLREKLEGAILNLAFTNDNLSGYLPKSNRSFTEDELVDAHLEGLTRLKEKRYSSNDVTPQHNAISYLNGTVLKIYALTGTEIVENITLFKVFKSRKLASIINKQYSDISYLYFDDNYAIVYVFCSKGESLRFYATPGVELTPEIYTELLNKVKPSAVNKIKDLISKMKPINSKTTHLNYTIGNILKSIGNWSVTDLRTLIPHCGPTYDRAAIEFKENDICVQTFLNNTKVDELTITPRIDSPVWRYNSLKRGDGKQLYVYANPGISAVAVFDDCKGKGLDINILRKQIN